MSKRSAPVIIGLLIGGGIGLFIIKHVSIEIVEGDILPLAIVLLGIALIFKFHSK
jgi:hypothetical protein